MVFILALLMIIPAASCRKQETVTVKRDLNEISEEAIGQIAEKRIFFGHMSVGNNILDGIREIQEREPRFKHLNIETFEAGKEIDRPGIYHFLLGNNAFPDKKVKACEDALLTGGAGQHFDMAVFKYCYVDFTEDTDVDRVFADYRRMISTLKGRYPDLIIIHMTVPLTVRYYGLKGWLKFTLGKKPPNDKRSQFNEMLKKEYGKSDPIFDLAGLESTDARGKKLTYTSGGKAVPYMASEYTDDGGHLNETGRMLAGLEFLKTLTSTK